MQFEMMKYAREHGATTYDFGGTDNNQIKIQNIMDYGHLSVFGAHI